MNLNEPSCVSRSPVPTSMRQKRGVWPAGLGAERILFSIKNAIFEVAMKSSNRTRRPTGPVLRTVFWIGAILSGLAFLQTLPVMLIEFVGRNYKMAFGYLISDVVPLVIGAFCIFEIWSDHRDRKNLAP